MKKTLIATAIVGTIFLQGCSSMTTIEPRTVDYTTLYGYEKISELQSKGYISRDELNSKCNTKDKTLRPVPKSEYESILEKVKTLAWKDPFSVKIVDLVYASEYERCMDSFDYYSVSVTDKSGTTASSSYEADPYMIKGKVYAKNGYGAYNGATAFFVYDDGRVDTNEYTLQYSNW